MINPTIIDLPKEFNSYTSIRKEKNEKKFFGSNVEQKGLFKFLDFNQNFTNFTNLQEVDNDQVTNFEDIYNFMFDELECHISFISSEKIKIKAKIKKITKTKPNPVIE